MQNRLSKKRNDFSKQIRRQQISAIMAEYRSKLVSSHQQQEELQFLGNILQNQPNRFTKLKIIIQEMIIYQNAFESLIEVSDDNEGLTRLFKNNKYAKLKVQLNAVQSIQIDYMVLVTIIKTLARDICTKIQVVNINFQESLKIKISQKLKEKIKIIEHQISQLVEIAHACNFLLSILSNSFHHNHDLMKELTSCLIELSCFKPRQYSSTQKLQITKQVNIKMGQFRQLLNTSIAENLYNLVKNTTIKDLSIDIVINILYIFGNIFVSLSFNSIAHTQKYKQLHQLCFGLIKNCVLQINSSMQSEQAVQIQSKRSRFSQFASVIVWFIRNQVLILEGLYKATRDPNQGNCDQPANEQWIMLMINILEQFSKDFKRNKKLNHSDSITLCDITSLLKLLKYDFHLEFSSMCDCLKYLQTFLNSQQGSANIGKLKGQIYELAAQLLNYHPEEIRQIIQINPNYGQLYNFVYKLAVGLLKGENQSLQSLQLCSAILSTCCNFKTIKQQFYQEVCLNFDTLVSSMSKNQTNVSYEQKRQRIIFIYEFLNQIENHQSLAMRNELLSYNSISAIMMLCSAIWEDIKNIDQDVIWTLNLLKVMAENDEYTNLLKQVVIGQGYRQQLQNLQAQANAQINLLAYELLELLEIQ